MVKTFDGELKTLSEITVAKAQKNYEETLFNTMCINVHNNLKELDGNIKELRKCIAKGKKLYGKCTMSCTYLSNFDAKIKGHMSELKTLTIGLHQPKIRIEDSENDIEKIHNVFRRIEYEKEKVITRLSILREYLTPKVVILQRQFEECLSAKNSYEKIAYIDLSAIKVVSNSLWTLISISNIVKGN